MSREPVFQITIKCALPVPGKDAASLANAAAELLKIIPTLAALGLEDITVENKLTSRPSKPTPASSPDGIPVTATLVFDDRAEVVTGTMPVLNAAQLSEIKAGVQAAAGMTGAVGDKPFDPVKDRPEFLTRTARAKG